MPHDPTGIAVTDLVKRYGPVTAVDNLSFTAEPGEVTGFLGPNGAGKTTTLRILLGLITADTGTASFGGRVYRDVSRPADLVGAALDVSAFHPARSGRNHLRVLCTVNGYPWSRADEVLGHVGLEAASQRQVGGYSLGMRQRLALAAALLGDPAVLVLDEPANGLDPEGILWMRHLLRRLADEGRTVLVSSHLLNEVQQLVDAVVIIHRGRLVRQGRLADLAGPQATAVSVRTPEPDRLVAALGDHVPQVERIDEDTLIVKGMTAGEVGHAAFGGGIELHLLANESSSLEQIYLTLTQAGDTQPEAG